MALPHSAARLLGLVLAFALVAVPASAGATEEVLLEGTPQWEAAADPSSTYKHAGSAFDQDSVAEAVPQGMNHDRQLLQACDPSRCICTTLGSCLYCLAGWYLVSSKI